MTSSRIRVLSSELADQIAAGEVVERPASVVKELAENALDAGARRIDIEIERGGLGRIAVTDDGFGMTPDEAHLALKRHATSKLRAIDDLYTLSSMGFRGEALPSIAAVSRLTLTTRAADAAADDGAYELTVNGGIAGEGRHVGAPVGTRVEVLDLCANVPARLKFMKSGPTESAHVSETVLRLALAFPHAHFRLRSEGRLTHDLPPHPSGLERARVALGRSRTPARLQLAGGAENGVTVEAYLGSPADSANTSRSTYLFVNQRFIRDRSLLHSISLGYGETLERGRFPLAVVHVTLAGNSVDVNVHPQKLEVRFARPQEVYGAVRHAIARAVADAPWLQSGAPVAPSDRAPAGSVRSRLGVYTLPPQASFDGVRGDGDPTRGSDGDLTRGSDGGRGDDGYGYGSGPRDNRWRAQEPQLGYAERRRRAEEAMRLFAPSEPLFDALPAMPRETDDVDANASTNNRPPLPTSSTNDNAFFSSLIYLGQLHRTYLVCQAQGELVLIDQHAAHERVAFQRLREAHSRRAAASQRLLLPATVELEPALAAAAAEHAELLTTLGFEIERFGERTLVVRALPDVLAQAEPSDVLTEVLGELTARDATELVSDRLDHVLATMACHSVVRAGDVLSEREVRALLVSMDGIDYRAHCPHGRPVLLRMSLGEIERRFGRT
ncbi:MAG TPA: DNA mismatch repair endonuclease MutL [Polyangia bacterium]|nr:DNA mismatch repair endonuclease MutL [Polyangia bacterium]